MERTAKILSVLTYPFLMPFYAFTVFYGTERQAYYYSVLSSVYYYFFVLLLVVLIHGMRLLECHTHIELKASHFGSWSVQQKKNSKTL